MACIVGTIRMCIAWGSTLMACSDDFRGDTFSKTFIKDKVFADKLICQSFGLNLPRIFDDAPIELKDIAVSFMLHVS